MRVLITGATGFVGRHVVRALEAQDRALTLAVRSSESVDDSTGWHQRHRIVSVGNIDRDTDWSRALEEVDAVVHLAAHAHVMNPSEKDEAAFWETNVHGTDRLAAQAVEAGVRQFVLMSSIGAVTASSDQRVTLDTPCQPVTPYGRSKLAGEESLRRRTRDSATAWTVLRPTLVYGRDNPGNMKRLISLVRAGLPLPLGAVRNRRSFTYVENLADLVAHALGHSGAANQVFLVADDGELSTVELIRKIGGATGRSTRVFKVPLVVLHGLARSLDTIASTTSRPIPRSQDAIERLSASLYVDTKHVRQKLGWSPPFGIDAALQGMLGAS